MGRQIYQPIAEGKFDKDDQALHRFGQEFKEVNEVDASLTPATSLTPASSSAKFFYVLPFLSSLLFL